jgi:hypothetical protein
LNMGYYSMPLDEKAKNLHVITVGTLPVWSASDEYQTCHQHLPTVHECLILQYGYHRHLSWQQNGAWLRYLWQTSNSRNLEYEMAYKAEGSPPLCTYPPHSEQQFYSGTIPAYSNPVSSTCMQQ